MGQSRLWCGLVVLLVACDGVDAVELTGASYADGLLSVGVIPKHGDAPVQPMGQASLEVVDGTEVRCTAGPLYFNSTHYQGPLLRLEARVACDPQGATQVRVRLTPEGGEEVAATGSLSVTAPVAAAVPAAEAGPGAPPAPAATPVPAGWPCRRTQRAAAATQDARFSYDYGVLRECTVPPFFGVVGCPTAEHHRLGTGTFNYDRSFRYGAGGRLVHVEQRHAPGTEPEQTIDVEYGPDGAPTQIVVHTRDRPDVTWRSSRQGSSVTETDGTTTVTYQLDEAGRVVSSERRSSMMGVSRTTWEWDGERPRETRTTNEAGDVIGTETFGYDC